MNELTTEDIIDAITETIRLYILASKLEEFGLMSIFWTQKVKLFYAALLANNSH